MCYFYKAIIMSNLHVSIVAKTDRRQADEQL